MTEQATLISTLENFFEKFTKIDNGVYSGEKIYNGKIYSISYFDLRDDVVSLSKDLKNFQDRIIGETFFEYSNELRWNSYLYVLAGPKSLKSQDLKNAKFSIEENREYARKFVLTQDELLSLLSNSLLFSADKDIETVDVTAAWENHLNNNHLNILLNKPARSRAIDQIESGQANRTYTKSKEFILGPKDTKLTKGFLRHLEIDRFRPIHNGEKYTFADVNLIVGPNGSGKTSLLEAIEYLYCGHNRRDDSSEHYKITGKVQFENRDELESVLATDDTARLKARNFSWYRKENHQSKNILDGFTKYNFLDTDAAFRISNELDSTTLNDDLRRLLVGSDASTLWDYLEKISEDLNSKIKDLTLRLSLRTQRHESLKKELERLTQAPSQASSLSKTFRAMLRELKWNGKEANSDEVVSEQERLNIEASVNALRHVISTMPNQHLTWALIQNQLHNLEKHCDAAKILDSRRIVIVESLEEKLKDISESQYNLAVLKEWCNYCIADAPKMFRAINEEERNVEAYKLKLGEMSSVTAPELPERYNNIALDSANLIIDEFIANARQEIQEAEVAQRNIESLQQSLSLLRRQLQEAARQIVHISGENEICPVCRTHHLPELLHSKIESLSGSEIQANIEDLVQRLQIAKRKEFELIQIKDNVTALKNIALKLDLDTKHISANDIRSSLVSLQNDLLNRINSYRKILDAVKNFKLIGILPERYNELRRIVELLFKESDDIESLELINDCIKELENNINTYREKQNQLNVDLADISNQLQELLFISPLSFTSPVVKADEVFISLEEALQQIKHKNTVIEKISKFIEISDGDSLSELEKKLITAVSAFDQAWHSVKTEFDANQLLERVRQEYEELSQENKVSRENIQRLKDANKALKTLKSEYSLSNATEKVFNLIGQQINEVFGRIHSPREYEFSNSSNSILFTCNEKAPRSLDQVSTGQRAAFALSIFLALNSTARSAPPVLLIDDPIAHIDDLNALSFLDYLRDLAINTNRQIFFATADTRVAALFDKKFSFLGQRKYQKIQLGPRAR